MKRLLLLLVLAAPAVQLHAATAARYLVATRPDAAGPRMQLLADDERARAHAVREFQHIDGFAATLTDDEVRTMRASRNVRWIEPDRERHLLSADATQTHFIVAPSAVRDTTRQTVPYGVTMVHADSVWPIATGARIRIGIIDTGITPDHPDLARAYRGGMNFVDPSKEPLDDNQHGTHVAGTIAAANDATGVVGVAPGAEIYALKVLDGSGSGRASAIVSAVDWAIEHHLNILSLSLGSEESSALEREAFQRASDAGLLTIAASGNESAETLLFPAGYPSVMAVGAVDQTSRIASFSNHGPTLALVGPGVGVLSDLPIGSGNLTSLQADAKEISALPLGPAASGTASGTYVYCGFGYPSDFTSDVRGKVALVQRGPTLAPLTFLDKVQNAWAGGAVGVVIFNNVPGALKGTLGNPTLWLPPAVAISREDGLALLEKRDARVALMTVPDDYGVLSGTSMATPHVTGVAALIWSARPAATAADVRHALLAGAVDLGAAGWDATYGYGLVDAWRAGHVLAPALFPIRERSARH